MTAPLASTRILITGLGAITPLGSDVETTWRAALAGHSGVRALDQPWADDLPVRIAAPVTTELPLSRVEARRMDRCSQLGIIAAREAWRNAGLEEAANRRTHDPRRVAVVAGVGMGGLSTTLNQQETLRTNGPRGISPHAVTMLIPSGPAAHISIEIGAQAGALSVASACASGAEAILRASQLIRAREADIVVAVAAEAPIVPLTIAGFAAMRALSTNNEHPTQASRPFDANRDGFIIGEGAATLILESEQSARARGAPSYCTFAAGALTTDSYHVALPAPHAIQSARSIEIALSRSNLTAHDIAHANAHATSTQAGDLAEALAYTKAFGDHSQKIAISATKSMTGHLLGAAGALEAVFTVMALVDRLAPPTINLNALDAGISLDVVKQTPRPLATGPINALSTSFGFGGHNVALIFQSDTEPER
ncbi:beta-ketoacyl-[acyl-carrier-protein] synthase family protein [Streptomyces rubiginosohelvolus]|uniref:beta-ketoacyl-[acyl-carrier-protein] synthase family protein n=1 Tax=Streptomyces rubiginosohelvolus TaxID=67362 RepID=UPI00381C7DF8